MDPFRSQALKVTIDLDSAKTLILICTYNERSNLPPLIDAIRKESPSPILVIDDGSPDGTGDWAKEASATIPNLQVVVRSGKLGLGTAILHGLKYAIEHQYEWLLNLDADFSHDPRDIPKLLGARGEDTQLIIGSRYVEGGGLRNCSWKRILVSRTANFYARLLLRWRISDCSSAFRCYRIATLKEVPLEQIQCQGYGFLEEVLWWILQTKGKTIEVPILYTEREMGESKISMKEAFGTLATLHRLFFKRRHK